MSFLVVLPITLVLRNLLAWHNQCLLGKGQDGVELRLANLTSSKLFVVVLKPEET